VSYRFDGLTEFISRRARVKLIEMLRNAGLSVQRIAENAGVTARSVQRWLDPENTHPRNSNLDILLELGLTVDRAKTLEILRQEVDLFSFLFNRFEVNSVHFEPIGIGKGGVN
jgi:transcriptional regulator with XRE-family HTH domain